MKHLKIFEAVETPMIAIELEEALMRILAKGAGINPMDVKSLDSYNKYVILHMKQGDNFRIDFDVKHV